MGMRDAVLAAIERVAPDVDTARLDDGVDVREAASLDSMDWIAILTAVQESTGITVPEIDYPKVATLAGFVAYLEARRVGVPADDD